MPPKELSTTSGTAQAVLYSRITQKHSGQERTDLWRSATLTRPKTKLLENHHVAVTQQNQEIRLQSCFYLLHTPTLQAAAANWTRSAHTAHLKVLLSPTLPHSVSQSLINFTRVRVVGHHVRGDLVLEGSSSPVGGTLGGWRWEEGRCHHDQGEVEELEAKGEQGKGGSMSVVHPYLPFQVPSGKSLQTDAKLLSLSSLNPRIFKGKRHMPFLFYIFKYVSEHQMEHTELLRVEFCFLKERPIFKRWEKLLVDSYLHKELKGLRTTTFLNKASPWQEK